MYMVVKIFHTVYSFKVKKKSFIRNSMQKSYEQIHFTRYISKLKPEVNNNWWWIMKELGEKGPSGPGS